MLILFWQHEVLQFATKHFCILQNKTKKSNNNISFLENDRYLIILLMILHSLTISIYESFNLWNGKKDSRYF